MKKSYFKRILILCTALLNVVILNGSEDHTTSGRVGWKAKNLKRQPWLFLEKLINTLFFWDENHCENSIEEDEYIEYSFFGWNIVTILLIVIYLIWG